MKFAGFDGPIDQMAWRESVHIPRRFFSIDGQQHVQVNLDLMAIPSDEKCRTTFRIKQALNALSEQTQLAAASVVIAALDGKRKTNKVKN